MERTDHYDSAGRLVRSDEDARGVAGVRAALQVRLDEALWRCLAPTDYHVIRTAETRQLPARELSQFRAQARADHASMEAELARVTYQNLVRSDIEGRILELSLRRYTKPTS